MGAFEASDLDSPGEAQLVFYLTVYFISHVNVAISEKDYDVYVFQFVVDYFSWLVANWLQNSQKLHNKVHVELITQVVVSVLVLGA